MKNNINQMDTNQLLTAILEEIKSHKEKIVMCTNCKEKYATTMCDVCCYATCCDCVVSLVLECTRGYYENPNDWMYKNSKNSKKYKQIGIVLIKRCLNCRDGGQYSVHVEEYEV